MTALYEPPEVLRFHCASCRAELTVPATLAGIEGPCPSCYQTIRAPRTVPEAHYVDDFEMEEPDETPPVFPPRPAGVPPASPLARKPALAEMFPPVMSEKQFKARRAIPAPEEPLDDSWRARSKDQRRKSRRVHKAERVAHTFLESRGFALARVALILVSAALMVFLFNYLQSHQWRLPGMAPAVANDKHGAAGGATRPAGSDPNELMADDDTEIPPAAPGIPAGPGAGQARPVTNGRRVP